MNWQPFMNNVYTETWYVGTFIVFSNFIPIFPGCEGTARRENYANTACLQFP